MGIILFPREQWDPVPTFDIGFLIVLGRRYFFNVKYLFYSILWFLFEAFFLGAFSVKFGGKVASGLRLPWTGLFFALLVFCILGFNIPRHPLLAIGY